MNGKSSSLSKCLKTVEVYLPVSWVFFSLSGCSCYPRVELRPKVDIRTY